MNSLVLKNDDVIDVEIIETGIDLYSENQLGIDIFFGDLEAIKIKSVPDRIKMYPESVIIDLYKEFTKDRYGKEFGVGGEASFSYRNDLKNFLLEDDKKLNIIERAIIEEGNQSKHQKKYLKYKNEILEYRLKILKLYNFLKKELFNGGSGLFKINYNNINNINDLKNEINKNFDNILNIFLDGSIFLIEEDNLEKENGLNQILSQIFGTIKYWEKNILKNEIKSMILSIFENFFQDEEFMEKILNKENLIIVNSCNDNILNPELEKIRRHAQTCFYEKQILDKFKLNNKIK